MGVGVKVDLDDVTIVVTGVLLVVVPGVGTVSGSVLELVLVVEHVVLMGSPAGRVGVFVTEIFRFGCRLFFARNWWCSCVIISAGASDLLSCNSVWTLIFESVDIIVSIVAVLCAITSSRC